MLRLSIVCVLLMSALVAAGQNVYVTRTGAKYHTASCRYAKTAFIATLEDALKRRLSPCSVCKPTAGLTEEQLNNTASPALHSTPNQAPQNTTSKQCYGTTKAGARCKRLTTEPSGYCFQHKE